MVDTLSTKNSGQTHASRNAVTTVTAKNPIIYDD